MTAALTLLEADSTSARLFGAAATVVHRTNRVEHERRRGHGLTSVESMELLDVLTDLPARMPVPVSSVRRQDLRVLHRAPAGVVEVTVSTVTRLVEPVVTPVLAMVHTSRWREGLADASEFAAYCPRMVVVDELPDNRDEALAEASWYGIGVAVGPRSAPEVVLEPEPLPDWQPTVAWWRFCERVYRHATIA